MVDYPRKLPQDPPTIKLLAIDDETRILDLIVTALEQKGLQILTATDPDQGYEIFLRERPAIVLTDLMMPKLSGMELLERIVAADPATEVILMTGHYSTDSAVEAIKKGASDYLTKPIDIQNLRSRVSGLIAEAQKRFRAAQLDDALIQTYQFHGIVGRSPLMLDMFSRMRRVAPHYRTVLITGATGTGKELVARALHGLSPVSEKQMAVYNCAAVTESLVESELFGYTKGAFTGALQDKIGLFEYANGGTVFLDEIGEMAPNAQAKLLRVLQNQEIQRVGSPAVRKVDVRVIAATNRDLRSQVKQGRFREDLFYRLATVEITVPSLCERREDLPLLERYFIERFSAEYNKPVQGLTRRAQTLLAKYHWPGNVRELENAIANACMMCTGDSIDILDLPEALRNVAMAAKAESDDVLPLEEMERRYVLRILEQFGGNKARAAEVLGIGRGSLYRILRDKEAVDADPVERSG
jgi:DNA-binding NtrC family response regulator